MSKDDNSDDQAARSSEKATAFGTGLAGSQAANADVAAADAMRRGMDAFREAAAAAGDRPVDKVQGNLFEYIEVAKFNTEASRSGADTAARVTEAHGRPHAAADIEITRGGKVVDEVQAKSYSKGSDAAGALRKDDYQGMQRLVPEDKVDRVRELTESRADSKSIYARDYQDSADNLTGQLKDRDSGTASGGTTYEESTLAAKNPDAYAMVRETMEVGKAAGRAGKTAAVGGAVVGGAISAVRNCYRVSRGDAEAGEAVVEVCKDTAKSGARSFGVGAGSVVVRHAGAKAGVNALTKSNIATALAAGTLEVGGAVYDFARGEISAEEAMQQMGETGACTVSSLYTGAAAGAVFGPPGAIVGSIVGYAVSSQIYQSAVAIIREADIAAQEAERLLALADAACEQMAAQRQEFERLVEETVDKRSAEFEHCIDSIDAALASENHAACVAALSDLTALVGKELKFERFEDFDRFMLESDEPFVL